MPATSAAGICSSADLMALAKLRQAVLSKQRGFPQIARLNASPEAVGYASLPNVATFGTRGPLTPDHSIRTKRARPSIGDDIDALRAQVCRRLPGLSSPQRQRAHQARQRSASALWPNKGIVSFGDTLKDASIVADIAESIGIHRRLGRSRRRLEPLPESDIFAIEHLD